ncbi:hypothetical protein DK237_02315 [Streptococcus suis]|nr:hypothetical protein CR542_09375 [Streptococcus suis]MBS8098484.1 hypothetical protein [Streptococcus suis]QDS24078.1 hypothetical protein FPT06_07300 [Streptococcus suis]QLL46703.1 hypothetical protein DK237_02315 [Streptococcus suis]QLL48788.1 hypothetical protein DK875_02415 [Streptococcus suis]
MGKNSTKIKRVRLPTPAQLIRPDLECKTRTNLPINHCAEMLTRTLSSGPGLFAQPHDFQPSIVHWIIEAVNNLLK